MAFLNLFKRGKKEKKEQEKFRAKQKPAKEKRAELKLEKKAAEQEKLVERKETAKKEPVGEKEPVHEGRVQKKPRGELKTAYRVLKSPQITEKASHLAEKNDYVFKVAKRANKTEVKKAIEEVYGVQALKVRIINIPKKRKRLGRTQGWKPGYKKAIVRLREGQSIETVPR